MNEEEKTPPVRGRPRSTEVNESILSAFIEEIQNDGYAAVSIDAIAKRAGVSRATIYRRYRDKSEIALDVATHVASDLERKPTGNFDKDIAQFMRLTFKTANKLGPLFTALMAEAQANKTFAELVWTNYSSMRRQYLANILQSNAPDKDVDFILDLVFGAIWYRMMSGHAPLNKAFADNLIASAKTLLRDGW